MTIAPALGAIALPLLLGLAFLGVARSTRPGWRQLGSWVIAAAASIVAVATIALYDYGADGLLHPERKHQLQEIGTTAVAMGVLATEAVLISRWALTVGGTRAPFRFLTLFTSATLGVWFLTGLLLWALLPGS